MNCFQMCIGTILSGSFNWSEQYSIPVVGKIPRGLPIMQLPRMDLIPDCAPTAFAITIVTIAIHISMSKMIAKRLSYEIDPSQEMYAVGFTSLLSSVFPVFPCSTALSQTMVAVEGGAKTLLSNCFTCAFLAAVILWCGPFFESLPLCVLSTVIIVALRPMFMKFKDLPNLWKLSKLDCVSFFHFTRNRN